MSIEAMKMALEAMENSRVFVTTREKIKHPEGTEWYDERIHALRAAIEQANKQEPVAWMWSDGTTTSDPDRADGTWSPLYTAQRQWVGLTEEEIYQIGLDTPIGATNFARAIEAKLKEKNT